MDITKGVFEGHEGAGWEITRAVDDLNSLGTVIFGGRLDILDLEDGHGAS